MRLQAFLLVAATFVCFAQTPAAPSAPPEVDQALRARATKFLEFQTQGNFSKAFDFVAEDSRDYYFSAPKEKTSSFVIDEVKYSDDLSTAAVKSTMKRQVLLAGHPVELPQVLVSQWKMEKGEWFWYHDASKDVTATILGDVPAVAADPAAQAALPKDLSPKAALEAAAKIAPKATIDKKFVAFPPRKEATEQVIFNNSNGGTVRVYVQVRGASDRITAEPRDFFVNPKAEVPIKITYKPMEGPTPRTVVAFTVEPFGSVYILPVRFIRETPPAKPSAPPPPPAAPAQ